MKKKRIVITTAGGHFTAALAVIEELQKKGGWEVYWVGASSAFERARVPALESQVLPKLGIPYWGIKTGKLQRGKPLAAFLSLLRLPVGFAQSLLILREIKPSVLLSFGGYVSVPLSYAAWLLRIPVIVHEQTATSGLANRLVGKIAKRVAVSHAASSKDFPHQKTIVSGNPVRKVIWEIAKDRRQEKEDRRRTIYVTGGSRGSRTINKVVFEALPKLLKLGTVYHQTGPFDLGRAQEVKERLGPQSADYVPAANFQPEEVEEIYKKASLVISRAGANTVSELEVLGIPSILIPIPWAERNEQQKNAKILEDRGQAITVSEKELSQEKLISEAKKLLEEPRRLRGKLILAKKEAAQKIVQLVEEVVG